MKKKQEVLTCKIDSDLFEIIRKIPNRSEFIRSAILAALESLCPLCNGTGILTPKQKEHWEEFIHHHSIEKCDECQEFILVCKK